MLASPRKDHGGTCRPSAPCEVQFQADEHSRFPWRGSRFGPGGAPFALPSVLISDALEHIEPLAHDGLALWAEPGRAVGDPFGTFVRPVDLGVGAVLSGRVRAPRRLRGKFVVRRGALEGAHGRGPYMVEMTQRWVAAPSSSRRSRTTTVPLGRRAPQRYGGGTDRIGSRMRVTSGHPCPDRNCCGQKCAHLSSMDTGSRSAS